MRKVLFILGQLSDDDVDWLGKAGTRQRVRRGAVIIQQGGRIEAMYILLEGLLSVSIAGHGEIAQLSSGEIVGEMSLIDSRPPSATVTALEDCTVLAVAHRALADKLAEDAAFAARFYRALATFLSERMRGTLQRLGYGGDQGLKAEIEQEGELDDNVLDNVSLAGARFDRMLKKLLGGGAGPAG
jgi:CRP/FNR family transcriptional regulator, cyclic AMP receptor protein